MSAYIAFTSSYQCPLLSEAEQSAYLESSCWHHLVLRWVVVQLQDTIVLLVVYQAQFPQAKTSSPYLVVFGYILIV